MMEPDEFEYIAQVNEVPKKQGLVRIVQEHEIAIFRAEGKFYAVSNVCPHQHAPVIAEGIRDGNIITCPMHGWSYDIETGKSTNGSGGLTCFDLKIDGDRIFVKRPLSPPGFSWWNNEI